MVGYCDEKADLVLDAFNGHPSCWKVSLIDSYYLNESVKTTLKRVAMISTENINARWNSCHRAWSRFTTTTKGWEKKKTIYRRKQRTIPLLAFLTSKRTYKRYTSFSSTWLEMIQGHLRKFYLINTINIELTSESVNLHSFLFCLVYPIFQSLVQSLDIVKMDCYRV